MYDYNIFPSYDIEKFKTACKKIENFVPDLQKEQILIDVDSTVIQIYHKENFKIKVTCDIFVDAVWVESETELSFLKDI